LKFFDVGGISKTKAPSKDFLDTTQKVFWSRFKTELIYEISHLSDSRIEWNFSEKWNPVIGAHLLRPAGRCGQDDRLEFATRTNKSGHILDHAHYWKVDLAAKVQLLTNVQK
jgi:hypothetical protein